VLTDDVRSYAQDPNFATLTTLREDGQPTTQVMWIDCDDTALLINTEEHRRKVANVARDPRVNVVIWDRDNPYHYVEVRGEVVEKIDGQRARDHIDELSQKYHGRPYDPNAIQTSRVILRIAPLHSRTR